MDVEVVLNCVCDIQLRDSNPETSLYTCWHVRSGGSHLFDEVLNLVYITISLSTHFVHVTISNKGPFGLSNQSFFK